MLAPSTTLGALADLVLIVHAGIAVFIVAGLAVIVVGHLVGWRWVNRAWLRVLHVAAIAVVVGESVFGIACPLTTLESWLREHGGGVGFPGGFVEHWVGRLLFHQAPGWLFTAGYSVFGVMVLATWWLAPPIWKSDAARAA